MTKLKLGFNKDIDNQTYHDDREYVSSSGLKLFLKNPRAYYKSYVLNQDQEQINQSALDFGSYIHCRILEPHLLDKEFAVFTGHMRRGKVWEEFEEDNKDKIIITKSQKNSADELLENFENATVILGQKEIEKEVPVSSFFLHGNAEETLCHEIGGIKVKTRFDYRKEFEDFGSINDIKTTNEYVDTKEQVEKICAKWGYDISAALYVDVATEVTGKPHDFYFCFISKKDGDCRLYRASEQMLQLGREKYLKAIEGLSKARKTGVYYENRIEEINSIEL